jgi:hypothetical protein
MLFLVTLGESMVCVVVERSDRGIFLMLHMLNYIRLQPLLPYYTKLEYDPCMK